MGILNYLLKQAAINATKDVAISALDAATKVSDNAAKVADIKAREYRIVKFPKSSTDYDGMNYMNVYSELSSCGFINIVCVPIPDLINGLITKNGSVKRVLINGKEDIRSKSKFYANTNIVIEYHTYKNPQHGAPLIFPPQYTVHQMPSQPTTPVAPPQNESSSKINFCPNCGLKLNVQNNFCPNCGFKFPR